MPAAAVKTFAKKAKISIDKSEEYWESAKEYVSKHEGLSPEKDKNQYWF